MRRTGVEEQPRQKQRKRRAGGEATPESLAEPGVRHRGASKQQAEGASEGVPTMAMLRKYLQLCGRELAEEAPWLRRWAQRAGPREPSGSEQTFASSPGNSAGRRRGGARAGPEKPRAPPLPPRQHCGEGREEGRCCLLLCCRRPAGAEAGSWLLRGTRRAGPARWRPRSRQQASVQRQRFPPPGSPWQGTPS